MDVTGGPHTTPISDYNSEGHHLIIQWPDFSQNKQKVTEIHLPDKLRPFLP